MKKSKNQLNEIKLVGISVKTNNAAEMNPDTGKIMPTINKYFSNNINEKISNRKNPGAMYCVYADYEGDHNGEYTYFVGEEVISFDNVDSTLKTHTIPQQKYVKFEVAPGKMPEICINAWKEIWSMDSNSLGGERSFVADFEIYDKTPEAIEKEGFNIYIGIK
ncbi:GyrI-like domain-containing protein [Candidatus Cytomitobacter indipagum]|uniref:GyrI-like domain-containing protein n=1 Tax=Candidatus Cytomitobacter indipagum TaxID=2601575 RepID=A0A5C0UES7_9PROT|nr:GyrI-like domain-containing protein [Candidatus Cytomitobacter indipagum]QEK38143.1 GyrI-like domain-containing protein [Candidatus Cytomitobacter indipagum]